MIPNVLLPATSGKGGVGKSTLLAHVAGLAAAGGWHVLAVDCDRSGDLATNLGYQSRSDGGLNLADAVCNNVALTPLTAVRERLDVVPGGVHLDRVEAHLTQLALSGAFHQGALQAVLEPLASAYDLVVIDLPPTSGLVHTAAYTAARALVISTNGDQASINGLGAVYERYLQVHATTNPSLEVLGVVLNAVDARATTTNREIVARITELLHNKVPLFTPAVRYAGSAAIDLRQHGLLASEYEAAKAHSTRSRLADLRSGQPGARRRFAANAEAYAADLASVVDQILAAFVALDVPVDLTDRPAPAPPPAPEGAK